MTSIAEDLQTLLDQQVKRSATRGILMGVQSGDKQIDFVGAAGAASPDQPFFMASITKMVTTAVLMQLVDEQRITLDDPVATHQKKSRRRLNRHQKSNQKAPGTATRRLFAARLEGLPKWKRTTSAGVPRE